VYPDARPPTVIVDGQVLTDVAGVWFRKPLNVSAADLPVDQEVAPYSVSAMRVQYSQLLTEFPGARWATLLDEDRLPDLSSLHLAPFIFQVAPDVVRDP
jgi:hypothetical protein